jgi:hypothetical protein
MEFAPRFRVLERIVREAFDAAKIDAGADAASVALDLTDERVLRLLKTRAGICVELPAGPVHVTWAATGSLWAAAQGAARLARRMSEGKRAGKERLQIEAGSVEELGLLLVDLALKLITVDAPATADGSTVRWPATLPDPEPSPPAGTDAALGNALFRRAFEWIMRHELAHVTLKHLDRERQEGKPSSTYEAEADHQATDWSRRDRNPDAARGLGTKPSQDELQLELLATAAGFGLIWVAMIESEIGITSKEHPPIAERLFSTMNRFNLRDDSFAFEVISDVLKAWLDPEGSWSTEPFPTSRDALEVSLVKLQDYMRRFRRWP